MVSRNNAIIGSEQKSIGDLNSGSVRAFSMDVDFSGSGEATGICLTDCTNC